MYIQLHQRLETAADAAEQAQTEDRPTQGTGKGAAVAGGDQSSGRSRTDQSTALRSFSKQNKPRFFFVSFFVNIIRKNESRVQNGTVQTGLYHNHHFYTKKSNKVSRLNVVQEVHTFTIMAHI